MFRSDYPLRALGCKPGAVFWWKLPAVGFGDLALDAVEHEPVHLAPYDFIEALQVLSRRGLVVPSFRHGTEYAD